MPDSRFLLPVASLQEWDVFSSANNTFIHLMIGGQTDLA
jgi:hypothetical protein